MKKDYKGYAIFAAVILFMIVSIILSEKYLVNKMINKSFTLYTENSSLNTEKTLNVSAYNMHGIFSAKEEVFDPQKVMGNLEDKFIVESGTICHLATNSIKGEKLGDRTKCRIYSYDENLNHLEVQFEINEKREAFFESPKELGKYLYVFEIEYDNKDKLVYAFYLDVIEVKKDVNNVEEQNSYKDLENTNTCIDTMYTYSNGDFAKYISTAKKTKAISKNLIPYKIIYMYEKDLIKEYDVFKVENDVVFYDVANNQYLKLEGKYIEKFEKMK